MHRLLLAPAFELIILGASTSLGLTCRFVLFLSQLFLCLSYGTLMKLDFFALKKFFLRFSTPLAVPFHVFISYIRSYFSFLMFTFSSSSHLFSHTVALLSPLVACILLFPLTSPLPFLSHLSPLTSHIASLLAPFRSLLFYLSSVSTATARNNTNNIGSVMVAQDVGLEDILNHSTQRGKQQQ